MHFHIEKAKIRKGYSYPLSSSLFQAAVEQAHLVAHLQLIYSNTKTSNPILRAHYWLPNRRVSHERFYIVIGMVKASQKKDIADSIKTRALPELMQWMKKLQDEPANSTRLLKSNSFELHYLNGVLKSVIYPAINSKK